MSQNVIAHEHSHSSHIYGDTVEIYSVLSEVLWMIEWQQRRDLHSGSTVWHSVTSECLRARDFSYILKGSYIIFPCLFPHPERNPHRTVLQGLQWENQGAKGGNPSTNQDPCEGASVMLAVVVSNPPLTFYTSRTPPAHHCGNSTGCMTLPTHFHYSYSSSEVSLFHLHLLMKQYPEELGVKER